MNWEVKPLDSLCDEITVGFVGTMAAYYADEGILFLRSQNIEPYKLNLEPSQMKFITPEFHSKIQKSALKAGDIAIVRTGYPGTACVIPSELGEVNCADLVIARPSKGVDSKFICYFINSPIAMAMIGGSLVGSAQKHFNVGVAKRLEIPSPPLPTQQKIASILSAYDDLIENNLKRIRLLEEAAQHLYREWFVEFRFPGWEGVEFGGELPEGWERKVIGDYCKVGRGSSPRPINDQRYFEGGTIPWVKIADATSSNIFIYQTKLTVNDFGASFSRKLPPGSLIIAASGTLGFPMFLGVEACIHDGWIYLIDLTEIHKFFQFFAFKELTSYYNSNSYGAAIQNINTSLVSNSPIILPPNKLLIAFNRICEPLLNQIDNLQKQNQKLKESRDILLPRLMNQTIEV